jgi:hypothetical protein
MHGLFLSKKYAKKEHLFGDVLDRGGGRALALHCVVVGGVARVQAS